jgi:predicted anti-sigma-YlaC factor YlaD
VKAFLAIPALLLVPVLAGCSPKSYMVNRMADAMASGQDVFAADDDPQLVREAVPFGLKAMEGLLSGAPDNRGLIAALTRGYTQYAAAFVWQDAAESADPAQAAAGKARAKRLYLRAREYGLRGLSGRHPGFREALAGDPRVAAASAEREDVPLLFWTGVSWTLLVAASPDDPGMMADLPRCEALMRRVLALREDYDNGAVHEFFIGFEGGRSEAMGGSPERARRHFDRAMELSRGRKLSPMVTLAETVSVRMQNKKEFLELLEKVLSFDAREAAPENRLANLVAQRRAAWLKGRADDLFLE